MNNELLKKLYLQYYNEIYLYLCSLCHNAAVAEDLAQETFLKALLSLDESHTNMRAWLYTVARNLYFNFQKKYERHSSVSELPESTADEGTDDILNRIVFSEQRKMLYRAMKRLDIRCREVLTLQYFGNLSQKEIADILHITAENVRVLAYRGKKQIKQIMEKMQNEL